jgi:toxin ParE1/3/4
MADYNLSRQARAKVLEIYEYSFANFGERQADIYLEALYDAFARIADMPSIGRIFHDFRRHDHDQYAIFYLVTNDEIEIVQIYHHNEDIARKLT